MWMDLESPRGIFLSIVFFLYLNAMRGARAWHSRYRNLSVEKTA
jgi:hypothetical protein